MRAITSHHSRGFSLIELLIAIFILGIGIISIAAIFPAGISQQQRTADDIIGPIVAHNAMTLLRSRLEQEDFGLCEEFDSLSPKQWSPDLCEFTTFPQNVNPWPTICGDWMWRRPSIFESTFSDPMLQGAIDIFGTSGNGMISEQWYPEPVPGIPYNTAKYPGDPSVEFPLPRPPVIRILASERQYPMWQGDPRSENATLPIPFDLNDRPNASYYWDCMFRKYEGKILVAVFVYRVLEPGSTDTAGAYVVDTHDPYDPAIQLAVPGFPRHVNLDWPDTLASTGAWNARDNANPGDPEELLEATVNDNPLFPEHQWQYPGQWLVDQNGHVHRVQHGRRRASDLLPVRLAAPPVEIQADPSPINVNWWSDQTNQPVAGYIYQGVVTDIWFLPTADSLGRTIIPVFATVQEL